MASISHDGGGFRRILFKLNGKRIGIRLGHISLRSAETIRTHLEEILEARGIGRSIEPDTLKWLREVDSDLHAKLAEKRLAPSRSTPSTAEVGQFVDDYIAKRSAKPASKEIWRQGKLGLVAFFGASRPLSAINAGMADDYVEYLKTLPIKSRARKPGEAAPVKVLAPMTVWKRLQFAKMVFRAAARHKLIEADPFADVKYKPTKPDRSQFITPEETAKLLDACPAGPDWRLIVAMARWGGLRCPSEVLSLQWSDIDWERSRVTVHSPKTEHHAGGDMRVMPLFPELRRELEAAWTPESTGYIVDEKYRQRAMGPSGWRNCNLRTTFEKIIKRAGLTPWPRLFHNLRSSRQTELQERFPSHVVCAWMGNSPEIAREHYLQVTDEHFGKAAQICAQTTANSSRPETTSGPVSTQKVLSSPLESPLYTYTGGEDGIRTHGGL